MMRALPTPVLRRGLSRQRWTVRGQVQGVGFRPFVYRTAQQCGVRGWVRNDSAGACLEVQGSQRQLREFETGLRTNLPPLARIHTIDRRTVPVRKETEFRITDSTTECAADADIAIDTAVCRDCVREIFDPLDRRRRYALNNCTQCGPRFSIIRRTPYDRCNTTMVGFEMCVECRHEYEESADRRYHAQPIACHTCGPQIELVDSIGHPIDGDPIGEAQQRLLAGRIVAIKGLGGFHLAVRADAQSAVRRLRDLKHRPSKPLAIMVRTVADARRIAVLVLRDVELLSSPQAPVLLCRRSGSNQICDSVAPGNHRLGLMLPYTPLHHLILAHSSMPPLVMTSANDGGEPLVTDNHDAITRLGGMCDALLWHDRPIQRGVDDSVLLSMADAAPIPLRRARGFVPTPIALTPPDYPDGIAVGGELKSTIAFVRSGRAILSQHLGELSHPDSFVLYQKTIEDLRRLFGIEPAWIAHDLHPGYLSTQHAVHLAASMRLPTIGVQHHHAHAASVLAEHGREGPVIAIVCDGTGYATDSTIWGGELLFADLCGFERLAHLAPMRLPGGDASARDPRRSALALLYQSLGPGFVESAWIRQLDFADDELVMLCEMIRCNIACVSSSSAGRMFDAVAALLGVCRSNQFEAQAAMALESAAEQSEASCDCCETLFQINSDGVIDLSPLIRELLARSDDRQPPAQLAALFHEHFAQAWATIAAQRARERGVKTIALSGGVFCNARLTDRITQLLRNSGLEVLRHEQVPPNDGGISLGQAAVASARYSAGRNGE